MKKLLRYYFCLLFLFCSVFVFGQTISYRTLTTEDGLPSNTVYQIKQDKKGFIWLATANGLVRYNGTEFQSSSLIASYPLDSHYLPSPKVQHTRFHYTHNSLDENDP